MFTKKLFGGPSGKRDEKEKKEKKTRMAIAKLFALSANAINYLSSKCKKGQNFSGALLPEPPPGLPHEPIADLTAP